MSGMDATWMPGFDPVTGILTLPLWMAGAVAALLVILAGRAFFRMGVSPAVSALPQYALVAIALLLAWSFLDRSATHDRAEARRALEARATALTAQSIAAGSALACLDAGTGEAVEAACEKSVFATPEAIAAAVSYVGAKLALMAEALDLAKSDDDYHGPALTDLRRTLEVDRFGIVAHVLASRDRCNIDQCNAFRMIPDRRQVAAHMKEDSFGQYVARHAPNWPPHGQAAGAASPPPEKEKATTAVAPSNWSFPSAASIPAVSIMNPEPSGPPGLPAGSVVPDGAGLPPAAAAALAAAAPPAAAPTAAAAQPARKPVVLPPKRNPPAPPNGVQATPLPAPTPPAPRAAAAGSPAAPASAPLNTTPAIQ